MCDNIEYLIKPHYTEPTLAVNFYKLSRPNNPQDNAKLLGTKRQTVWRVQGEALVKSDIFLDTESYVVQWEVDLKVDNTIISELLVFHWKGQNALKGFSPLPVEIEEHYPVERVVQWSEPALFFHSFSKPLIVYAGERNKNDLLHFFVIVGEELEEIHLYEVEPHKRNLRNKAGYLLVVPKEETIYYWFGNLVSERHKNAIKSLEIHKQFHSCNIKTENDEFLNHLLGDNTDYYHASIIGALFSPRLFYLNTITGSFLATEVEYPLRSSTTVAAFPFLQSHLYSATQPALFLLDDYTTIWLWQRGDDIEESYLNSALEFVKLYLNKKQEAFNVDVAFHKVYADSEPVEFKNLFPIWL